MLKALLEQDDDRAAADVPPRRAIACREAGFIGYELAELGPSRAMRLPPQPNGLLGAPCHRCGRAGCARVRRPGPALERGPPRRLRRRPAPADGSPPRVPPGGEETLDEAAAAAESLILGLRLDRGVSLTALLEPSFVDAFDWAVSAGLLEETEDARVHLTTRGRLLSNELFARLI